MPHDTPLIATVVVGLVLAFILGAIANRLRISPLVGYLLAGVLVGPKTPGFVADQALALELAEIGVILLMFGVGLHFSLKDLLSVKKIAIPGAIVQIAIATVLGMGLGWMLGWSAGVGFMFGLALSTASTVVLLRALQERRLIDTRRGRIAVGWLIVEDIAMVLALVLLPVLAGFLRDDAASSTGPAPTPLEIIEVVGVTLGKVTAFVIIMLLVGRRVIPWILHRIAHSGSRELFRLAVLSIALGVAFGAAQLFGVSFALGAFFAGMVMSESELSQQAAAETLPLRDAFAVLFFVSVGMLFDPLMLVEDFWPLMATLFIILIGKSTGALAIVLAFRYPMRTALTIAASLAQIGEFSFILASLGVALQILPERAQSLILAGAILSILANPLCFAGIDGIVRWLERRGGMQAESERAETGVSAEDVPEPPQRTALSDHAVLVGYGRVGSVIGEALRARGQPFLVIEENADLVDSLRKNGTEVMAGPAAPSVLLEAANIQGARWLFIAIPNAFEAGQYAQQARTANAAVTIIGRAHTDAEVEHLQSLGANITIMAERETARAMVNTAFTEAPGEGPDLPSPAVAGA